MLDGFEIPPVAGEFMKQVITAGGFGEGTLWRSYVGYLDD